MEEKRKDPCGNKTMTDRSGKEIEKGES